MSDTPLTQEEMQALVQRMKTSVEKTEEAMGLLQFVLTAGVDEERLYNGVVIKSLMGRTKDVVDKAIENGDIVIPSGKVIEDIYIDDSGELIIDYKEV